jgi:hypothetical protein
MFILAVDGYEGSGVRYGYLQRIEVYCPTLGDTRSSLYPSMVTLGCLDIRDKRGERQSCYSD